MTTPLIHIRGLYRRFSNAGEDISILKNINLDIYPGEMVAIIGQSGSGKSTLMNILGCLDRPSSGQYCLNGEDTAGLDARQRARLRREYIGFIFQRYHLLEHLQAWENTAMPAVYAGTGEGQRQARAKALLSRLGLSRHYHHKPGQLSGGQQQRVSIARALMNGGQIILADEPTGALDSHSGAEVMKILRELHEAGHTVILVTHDRDIAAHADRVITILDGEIIADQPQSACPCSIQTQTLSYLSPDTPQTADKRFAGRFTAAFKMAQRAIFSHKLRAFLTMLGIIIGIASVVSVVALGQGSQAKILERISDLGSNTIQIFPGRFGDRRAGRIKTLIPEDAAILARQDFIDSATPVVNAAANVRYGDKDLSGNITGVGEQFFQTQNIPIISGRNFNSDDVAAHAGVAVLNQNGADILFGKSRALGQIILLKNVPVRVIGIADTSRRQQNNAANNISVYLPYSAAMSRILGRSNVSGIIVRIKDGTDSTVAEDAVKRILLRRHGSEDFTLLNNDSLRQTITETTQTLTLLISAIAAIALLVGGIGVMNIMLVSVTERTGEIGIRMAVGARPGDIMLQFLIEALVLCLIGGILGVGAAYGLGWLLRVSHSPFTLVYSLRSVVVACACAGSIGVLFGYLPARNAAKLDPVVALNRV